MSYELHYKSGESQPEKPQDKRHLTECGCGSAHLGVVTSCVDNCRCWCHKPAPVAEETEIVMPAKDGVYNIGSSVEVLCIVNPSPNSTTKKSPIPLMQYAESNKRRAEVAEKHVENAERELAVLRGAHDLDQRLIQGLEKHNAALRGVVGKCENPLIYARRLIVGTVPITDCEREAAAKSIDAALAAVREYICERKNDDLSIIP